jgi:hypothetical protein
LADQTSSSIIFRQDSAAPNAKTPANEPGKRSGAWLKYKVNKAQAFVIGGYTPGNPLDALIVGHYEGDLRQQGAEWVCASVTA